MSQPRSSAALDLAAQLRLAAHSVAEQVRDAPPVSDGHDRGAASWETLAQWIVGCQARYAALVDSTQHAAVAATSVPPSTFAPQEGPSAETVVGSAVEEVRHLMDGMREAVAAEQLTAARLQFQLSLSEAKAGEMVDPAMHAQVLAEKEALSAALTVAVAGADRVHATSNAVRPTLLAEAAMAPPAARAHDVPALWVSAVQSLERRLAEQEAALREAGPAQAELAALTAECDELRDRHDAAAADAQQLMYENGVLAQQLASLLAQRPTAGTAPLPVRRSDLAAYGSFDLPSLAGVTGIAHAAPDAVPVTSASRARALYHAKSGGLVGSDATGASTVAGDVVDVRAMAVGDVAQLVRRLGELARELFAATQGRSRRGCLALPGGDVHAPLAVASQGPRKKRGRTADPVSPAAPVMPAFPSPAAVAVEEERSQLRRRCHHEDLVDSDNDGAPESAVVPREAPRRATADAAVMTECERELSELLLSTAPAALAVSVPPPPLDGLCTALTGSMELVATTLAAEHQPAPNLHGPQAQALATAAAHAVELQATIDELVDMVAKGDAAVEALQAEVVDARAAAAAVAPLQATVAALTGEAEALRALLACDAALAVAPNAAEDSRMATTEFLAALHQVEGLAAQSVGQHESVTAMLDHHRDAAAAARTVTSSPEVEAAAAKIPVLEATVAELRQRLEEMTQRFDATRADAIAAVEHRWRLDAELTAAVDKANAAEAALAAGLTPEAAAAVRQQVTDMQEQVATSQREREVEAQRAATLSASLDEAQNTVRAKDNDLDARRAANQELQVAVAAAKVAQQQADNLATSLRHDTNVLTQRVQTQEADVAARDAQIAALSEHLEDARALLLGKAALTAKQFAVHFPSDTAAALAHQRLASADAARCAAEDHAAELRCRLAAVQAQATAAEATAATATHGRHTLELQLLRRTQLHAQEVAVLDARVAELSAARAEAEDTAAALRRERDAALEREASLTRQVDTLASDPATHNVRLYGLTETRDLAAQLQELHQRTNAADSSRALAERQCVEATETARERTEAAEWAEAEARAARERRDEAEQAAAAAVSRADGADGVAAALTAELAELKAAHTALEGASRAAEDELQQRRAEVAQLEQQLEDAGEDQGRLQDSHDEATVALRDATEKLAAAVDQRDAAAVKVERLTADNVALEADRGKLRAAAADLQEKLAAQKEATAAARRAGGSGGGTRRAAQRSFATLVRSASS